jgi:hypothetical protein
MDLKRWTMLTDAEIKLLDLQVLTKYLGLVEAERFVAIIQREPFDYTVWRQNLDEELTLEEISGKAQLLQKKGA